MIRWTRPKRNKRHIEVEPDEIFLDSKNLPAFNTQQFEGRIEKAISKRNLFFLGLTFCFIGAIFLFRIGVLQVARGEQYFNRSLDNSLDKKLIFPDRGIIYDRNKVPLAWNSKAEDGEEFSHRSYIKDQGFGHLLGYVKYPTKDKSGVYWQKEFIGMDGIEKQYDERLGGTNGLKIFETNVKGQIQSENTVEPPQHGETMILSVDSRIQAKLFEFIKSFSENYFFQGGAGGIMDVNGGELLALANFPEYEPEVLSSGDDRQKINEYLHDKRKPFLNRAVSGLYTPGSIVKPIVALGALNEKIIDPLKKILSIGYIAIPNPYFPEKKSIFKDWKAHGWIDMRQAIAQSSDVYFYEIGGGFENQRGLGISNVEKYAKLFGLDEETGIDLSGENSGTIPTPVWKEIHFPGDPWRIGDTYNTSIGQYGFQTTPIEMLRAVGAIANNGRLLQPHFLTNGDPSKIFLERNVNISKEYFDIVHEGMRLAVTEGTASRLNLPFVKVSGKTGTAQLGVLKDKVNSWVIGFFPSDAPRYAFVIMMENGPATNSTSVSLIMSQLLEWMNLNAPEYLK